MDASNNRSAGFGFLIAGGLTMWFLAGVVTAVLSLDSQGKLPDLSFPIKVGGIWAAVGLLFVVTLPRWFTTNLERSLRTFKAGMPPESPMRVALQSAAIRATLLGAGTGFALARWVMPNLGLPDGLALADSPETWGVMLTTVAYVVCFPIAAAVASKLR